MDVPEPTKPRIGSLILQAAQAADQKDATSKSGSKALAAQAKKSKGRSKKALNIDFSSLEEDKEPEFGSTLFRAATPTGVPVPDGANPSTWTNEEKVSGSKSTNDSSTFETSVSFPFDGGRKQSSWYGGSSSTSWDFPPVKHPNEMSKRDMFFWLATLLLILLLTVFLALVIAFALDGQKKPVIQLKEFSVKSWTTWADTKTPAANPTVYLWGDAWVHFVIANPNYYKSVQYNTTFEIVYQGEVLGAPTAFRPNLQAAGDSFNYWTPWRCQSCKIVSQGANLIQAEKSGSVPLTVRILLGTQSGWDKTNGTFIKDIQVVVKNRQGTVVIEE